jgi:hypothetical protein
VLNCDDETIQAHTKIHAARFSGLPRIVVDLRTFQVSVKHCAACFVGVIISPIVPLIRTMTSRLGTLPRKLRSYRGEVCQQETHYLLLQPV